MVGSVYSMCVLVFVFCFLLFCFKISGTQLDMGDI